MYSTGTDDADVDKCRCASWQNNSAAELICGGFTASKIQWLIRHAIIFPADFRRTNIRRSAATEGSMPLYFTNQGSGLEKKR